MVDDQRSSAHAVSRAGRAGLTIADLPVLRDDAGNATEAVVDLLCEGTANHREVLWSSAAYAGYRRKRFDDGIIELVPNPGGSAQTLCGGCALRLVDGNDQFWRLRLVLL